MEKNIFENACFGKVYKTRDGRKAIFLGVSKSHQSCYEFRIEGYTTNSYFGFDGSYLVNHRESHCDIVSEWQEPIDEVELDRLAEVKEKIIIEIMYLIRCNKIKTSMPNNEIIKEFKKFYQCK